MKMKSLLMMAGVVLLAGAASADYFDDFDDGNADGWTEVDPIGSSGYPGGPYATFSNPGGGYRLSRSGKDIYAAQIIDAVNEAVDATGCSGEANCHDGEVCLTHFLWSDLSDQIHDFLGAISLASLVERQEIKTIAMRQEERELSRQSLAKDRIPALDPARSDQGPH